MIFFLSRKLFSAIPTLLLLCALIFFSLRLAPGGPFDTERAWPPEVKQNIEERYDLNRPLPVQFAKWLGGAVRGDLRESFQYIGKPVNEIISETLPVSVSLGTLAFGLALFVGIPLGVFSATGLGHGAFSRLAQSLFTFLTIVGVSLPSYLVASVLVLVFALKLGWFPPALWEDPLSFVLPMITLALRPLALVARLIRASMLEALQSDYIRVARSKGLSRLKILFKHALKNSVLPLIALLGPILANLITGSFLVEMVFQIPGLGKHFVSAVINRDYPLVMGVSLVYGAILIFSNLMFDLCLGLADPRVRVTV